MRKVRWIGWASLIVAIALVTAEPARGSEAQELVLPNGLRVVLIPYRANPVVASAVVVGAGVVHERPQDSGASHFLEHLLFNGTRTRSQKQLYDEVDRLGAYNNATTREDHTLFTILAAKDLAEQALAIQADMLFRSTIPAENFEKERKIVLEELAQDRNDPDYDVEAAFRAFAFAGTPIARPVLGTEASLQAIGRSDVVAYYRARYVPSNMTLVVMGDFEPGAMEAVVTRTFGAAPPAAAPRPARGVWPQPPRENLVVAKGSADSDRILAAFPLDLDPWDPRAAAVALMLDAASSGEDAPLRLALARRGVHATDPTLTLERRARPWSTVVFDARLEADSDPGAALDACADVLRQTAAGGAVRGRLDAAAARALADGAFARDQILYYPMLRSSMILGSPKGYLDREPSVAATLTPADWDAAARALAAGLPAMRARVTGPARAASSRSWTPAPPAPPGAAEADLRAGVLPDGLRYVVRKSDDSDVVAIHVAFAPRGAVEPAGKDGITDLLHRMMAKATVAHDAGSLSERISLLGARVKAFDDPSVPFDDYYTNAEYSWLRVEAPSRSWREAVALAAEIVRFPKLSAEGLDEARREMTRLIAKRDASPRERAAARLDGLLAPGHPLTRPVLGSAATLGSITLDDVASYQAASAVGRRTIVTIVGPIPGDAVVSGLTASFGALPAGDPPPPVPELPPDAKERSAEVALGKPQASIAMGEVIQVAEADRAPLAVAAAMLGERLAFDLRETRGLAYAVDAGVRPWGGAWRFDVTMGTRPDNVDAAIAGLLDGIRAFKDAAVSDDDVLRSVNAVRGRALMRRMTRISLAYESAMEAVRGLPPGDARRALDALSGVTPADVQRVARTYLDADRLARVVVR
jgi:zinc protease